MTQGAIYVSVDALKIHKTETHSQAAIDIVKEVTQEKEESNVWENLEIKANEFDCIQCNLQFKTNLDRLDHKKTKHINDNWPDSGSKKDLSMIKTSSISKPKKKDCL